MKYLIILLFTTGILLANNTPTPIQETTTIVGTYNGNANGKLNFLSNGKKIAFDAIDFKSSKVINLSDKKMKGQEFSITYISQTGESEAGGMVTTKKIVGIAYKS